MAIVIGKIISQIFKADSYHIFRVRIHGGVFVNVTYRGASSPPVRKTVELVLFGDWIIHAKYGRQFNVKRFEQSQIKPRAEWFEPKIIAGAAKAGI